MKLYYSTGSCSMACVIAAEELGLKIEMIEVSWNRNLKVAELESVNPLGVAPALVLDSGEVLTQNAAILEYFAESKADSKLLPKAGTLERLRVISWLSFVAADLHKAFVPAFLAESLTESEETQRQITSYSQKTVKGYLEHIENALKTSKFVAGNQFSVADCYLYVVLNWCEAIEVSFETYPLIKNYLSRVEDRPGVQRAMALEN